jgi:NitT/TauT family transport system substrate-binding protein
MKWKKIGAVLIVVAIAVVLVKLPKKNQPVEKKEQPPTKIGIIVYPPMGLFYVAQEKGFFREEGVNAEITLIEDENQAIPSIMSNQVQMLVSTPDFMTVAADAGVDATQIFFMDIGNGSDGLVVKKEVNDISDLKGKKVYLSIGTPSHFLFRYWSQEAGLRTSDFELINMSADQVGTAFVAGQIDYGMTWEPWLSNANQRPDGKVLMTSRAMPGIVGDTIMARRDYLKDHGREAQAIMRAYFKAVKYWETNQNEASVIIANHFGLKQEEIVAMMENVRLMNYEDNLKKFEKANDLNIYSLMQKSADIYLEDGVIKTKSNVDGLADPSLLKTLYR